jgi:hypothetical protein
LQGHHWSEEAITFRQLAQRLTAHPDNVIMQLRISYASEHPLYVSLVRFGIKSVFRY